MLWSLPAVSQIKTSALLSFAIFIASNTTDAGSEPSGFFTISHLDLSAQISNCSTAAALKVSAAAITTFFPWFVNLFAIFPIEVVFPTPFTPTTKMIDGFVSNFSSLSPTSKISIIISFKAFFTASSSSIFSCFILLLNFSIICIDVSIPISDVTKTSSSSSKRSSSTFLNALNTSFILLFIELFVFPSPFFNLSKKPIF